MHLHDVHIHKSMIHTENVNIYYITLMHILMNISYLQTAWSYATITAELRESLNAYIWCVHSYIEYIYIQRVNRHYHLNTHTRYTWKQLGVYLETVGSCATITDALWASLWQLHPPLTYFHDTHAHIHANINLGYIWTWIYPYMRTHTHQITNMGMCTNLAIRALSQNQSFEPIRAWAKRLFHSEITKTLNLICITTCRSQNFGESENAHFACVWRGLGCARYQYYREGIVRRSYNVLMCENGGHWVVHATSPIVKDLSGNVNTKP